MTLQTDIRQGKTLSSDLIMRIVCDRPFMTNATYKRALYFAKSWAKDEKRLTTAFVYANEKLFMQIIVKPDSTITVNRL